MVFFLSALAMFEAAAMTASYGSMVGFVMYLCSENTVPENIFACVSFTHRFQHWYFSYDVPITYNYLKFSTNIL